MQTRDSLEARRYGNASVVETKGALHQVAINGGWSGGLGRVLEPSNPQSDRIRGIATKHRANLYLIDYPHGDTGISLLGGKLDGIRHASDAVLGSLRDLGIDRCQLIGISLGSFVALNTATTQPEGLITDVGLVAPPIFLDKSPLRGAILAKEYAVNSWSDVNEPGRTVGSNVLDALKDVIKYVTKDPWLALRYVADITDFPTADILEILQDRGINVRIKTPKQCKLFSPDTVQSVLRRRDRTLRVTSYEEFPGKHIDLTDVAHSLDLGLEMLLPAS